MTKYIFFGKDKNGAMVQVFECVSPDVPTAEQVNTIYREMVRQVGLGVPRPSHYAALELVEIEQTEQVSAEPMLIHGTEVH